MKWREIVHFNRASATMSKVAPDAGGGKPRKVVILAT